MHGQMFDWFKIQYVGERTLQCCVQWFYGLEPETLKWILRRVHGSTPHIERCPATGITLTGKQETSILEINSAVEDPRKQLFFW